MRFALAGFVIVIGGMIGVSAIDSINKMQDSKMERFCKQIPVGASYDDVCARFRK